MMHITLLQVVLSGMIDLIIGGFHFNISDNGGRGEWESGTVYQVFNKDSLKINNNPSLVAEIFRQLKQMNGP